MTITTITFKDSAEVLIEEIKLYRNKSLKSTIKDFLGKRINQQRVEQILYPYYRQTEDRLGNTSVMPYIKIWYKSFIDSTIHSSFPTVTGKLTKRKIDTLLVGLINFYFISLNPFEKVITLKDLN